MSQGVPYSIEPLDKFHDRTGFSCGNGSLDQYIKNQASQDARKKYAAPFVLVENDKKVVLGYYTLSASRIPLEGFPKNIAKKLPRYPNVPATLLGRLAVDENHQGKGLGELLLIDALRKSLKQTDVIGSAAVVVEAIDEKAHKFYQKFEFIPFPDQANQLFLPIESISALF